jgi:hypothetical protein
VPDTPGVHLIDCPIDYADNDRILNREIKELSAAIECGGKPGLSFEEVAAAEPVAAGPTPA